MEVMKFLGPQLEEIDLLNESFLSTTHLCVDKCTMIPVTFVGQVFFRMKISNKVRTNNRELLIPRKTCDFCGRRRFE